MQFEKHDLFRTMLIKILKHTQLNFLERSCSWAVRSCLSG